MKLVNDNLFANPQRQSDFEDHFTELNSVATTGRWANTKDAAGTLALGVAGETTVALTTSNVDNNENYLATNTKWDVLANRPLVAEGRFQYAEAATDDANIILGIATYAANTLIDDGGGLVASFSGFTFHKVDGGTKWIVTSSVGATRYGASTTTVTAGGAGFFSVRIEVRPISSTQAEAVFLYDSAGGTNFSQMRDNTTNALIKHIITYTSFAAAPFGFGLKAGGATDETLVCDRVRVSQLL